MNAIEMIRAPRLTKDWIDAHMPDAAHYADFLRDTFREGKGVVIMVPHCGNWYMAAWAMAQYGHPLSAIAARQRNPYVDAWMKRQYGSIAVATGAPIIVAMMRRENGLHKVEYFGTLRPDPNAPDRKAEARRLTREALRLLNDGITRTPGQWFWYNKRWILQPVKHG